ncbi:uncharacterized protein BYT42DRAFT_609167 [Radiomyces spectabilis]|uniref:uncharacterized protein n=1 Tax=Radiomyces spectabilis TaxID=64574 RepID=UPI00221E5C63|nr:uncharacterized protein BYT42DRAFT_609167 [Radiomyces spectabilis]KAI8393370.1 hypothetical protein BYT42DRAFT_609167 [Radiomyces spectabilis]
MSNLESRLPKRFIACNNQQCSKVYKYLDLSIHTKIEGPDPRDHFANERNMLTWLRTGMTLCLIGFMTLLDLPTKHFAPAHSLPWTEDAVPTKARIVACIFVGLGLVSICAAVLNYFKNQRRIVHRLFSVGHGWMGYSMALLIMLFACFIMVIALTES